MSEFHVGARKANAVLAELAEFDSTREADPAPVRRLHSVPAPVPDADQGAETADVAVAELPQVQPAADPVSDPVSDPADGQDQPGGDTAPATVEPSVPDAPATPTAPDPTESTPTPDRVRVRRGRVQPWPVLLLALPAFVAIWAGWVGLGGLTGFGVVHPLPGIWDEFELNTAITLPIGMETYAAYALRVWLSGAVPQRAREFAKWSAIASLALGALGQVAYHLMTAAGVTSAPWPITTAVACLPVAVLGMGAALAHLMHTTDGEDNA